MRGVACRGRVWYARLDHGGTAQQAGGMRVADQEVLEEQGNSMTEQDKMASSLALKYNSNVLPLHVWQEGLNLSDEDVIEAPSPISWGRLKFYMEQHTD